MSDRRSTAVSLHRIGSDEIWSNVDTLNKRDTVNFLLGRVMTSSDISSHRIRVTEVAPTNSSIRGDEPTGWRIPLEQFTAKRQTNRTRHKSRRLRSYYKRQDELITAYEDIALNIEVDMYQADPELHYQKAVLYSTVSLMANVLLTAGKAVAGALSGSIAIISSLVDSVLDLFSGGVMWWATRQVKHRDLLQYPQGRTKLEPVAVIILSVVMAFTSLQLIREAIEKCIALSGGNVDLLPVVEVATFVITGSTVVVKLALWLCCRNVRSSAVQALAQDHRNDVLSNTAALICGYLGSAEFFSETEIYGFAYVDPVGAVLISIYIVVVWWHTGSTQIKMLTGHTASPDFLSKLTWVSVNHHPKIKQIDTVRAFHFGNNFLVEVDIVLSGDMRLEEAHDIGETLQHRLESLNEVERAFVHLDYEFTHNPHLEHKIV